MDARPRNFALPLSIAAKSGIAETASLPILTDRLRPIVAYVASLRGDSLSLAGDVAVSFVFGGYKWERLEEQRDPHKLP